MAMGPKILKLVSASALLLLGAALALPADASTTKTHVRKSVAKPAAVRSVKVIAHKAAVRVEAARPSFGQIAGLHGTGDQLALKSSVALVLDQDTNEVLFSKN